MKIYDCFTFFNELDLLEMRLNILDEVVDYFVLVEATTTFQNMGKPLYFEENKKRYEKFLHKIIHIIVDDMPSDKPFENEYFQRNAISRGLINCNENDIIIISDVDEIPNPEAIKVGLKKDFPILFNQKLFYYYLNNLCVDLENFPCSAMIEFKNLDGIQDFRDKVMDFHANIHKNNFYSDYFTLVENGGWHFSYLGGIDAIIKKIESFAHDEYNNKEYKNYEKIEKLINSGKDIFGRDLSFKIINIEENFPKYIIDNQDKYEKLVYQDLNKVMLFDQYSRYSALVSIMKKCLYTSNDTILDIGCGHDHLLEQFFEKNSMFFVDPLLEEEDRNKYINGYIFDTRLDNRKFDYVTAIDVLEHIPFDLREKFIERMCELSNKYVILAFPSSENEKAVEIDKSVNEEYKRMYNKDYPWLEEHFAYDLPSLSNLKNQLKTLGWNVTHIGHGYAPWLKEMMNTIVPTWDCLETHELLLKFSKDFNENLAKYDFNEPYYREFVVASKGVLPDLLNLKIDIDEKSKSFFDNKIKELKKDLYYKIFKISKEKDNIRVEKEKEIQKISLWTKDLDQIIKEKNMELNSIKNKIFNLSDDVFSIYIRLEFINRNYFLRNIKKVLTGKLTYKSIIHKILKKVFPTSIVNKIEKFYYSKNINKVENNNFILNLQNEKTLYVFPVIDWYFRIQRPQQIAKSFLNNGYVIIYFKTKFNICSTPGYISELIDNKIINVTLFLNEEKNIYKEKLSDENLDFLLQGIMKFEKDFLINKRLSIVDHPFWFPLSKKLSGNFNIYDCMDYHPGFGDESKYLIELEEMAMTQSELLVLSSSDLYKRFSNKNKNSILVRNGCEFEFFNKRPENIYKSKYEKIIGYYGAISSWFDTDIIVDLALHFSNYEFLLVGSTLGCENIEKIKEIKNITLIGEVEYTELTKYLYSFDVAIMPFRINELTIATNPVKVYEYLCSGVPVVSTKLPEVEVMNEVVYTAISVDDFISQINMALTTIDEDSRKKRVNFAKNNDWYSRFLDIKNKIIEINIKMPKVSIILVTYNNLNFTKECLESMEKYNNYANCEIIVVDNLSQDGTRDFLKKYEESHSNFKAILHDSNSGFAAGNNIGINNATGDYIILLNNDTKVTPNWIQNLIKHFDYDSNIGIVGPRTNNIGNESRIKTNYSNTVEMIEFSYDIYYKNISKQYNIPVLAFFCVVMKKELINKVGILDEIFGIGMFEDDDYCMRVKEQGYKLICADDVFIHHHLGASFDKNPEWKQQLFKKNKAIYEKKWGKWKEHSYRKDIK